MQIESLELENISRFDAFTCEFSPGLNILVGPNGSGKSSILDALFYGLYSPVRDRRSFLKSGATGGGIKIRFKVQDRRYFLTKRFNKSGITKATLVLLDGEREEMVAYGTQQVRSWIEDTIGTEDARKWYLSQGEIARFAEEVFSKNSVNLARLLGLGKVDSLLGDIQTILDETYPFQENEYINLSAMLSSSRILVKEYEDRIADLRSKANGHDLDALPRVIIQKRSEVDRLKEMLQLVTIRERCQELARRVRQLEQNQEELLRELNEEKSKLNQVYQDFRRRYSDLFPDLPEDAVTGVRSLWDLRGQVDARAAQVRMAQLQEAMQKAHRLLVRLRDLSMEPLKAFRSRPVACSRKFDEVSRVYYRVQDQIGVYRSLLSGGADYQTCPVCLRPWDDSGNVHLREHLAVLEQQSVELSSQMQELAKFIGERKRVRQGIREARTQRSVLQDELVLVNESMERLKTFQDRDLHTLRMETALNGEDTTKLFNILSRITELENELQRLDRELSLARNDLESTQQGVTGWETLNPSLTVQDVSQQLTQATVELQNLQDIYKEYERLKHDLELTQQQIQGLSGSVEKLQTTRSFRQHAIEGVVRPFVQEADRVIRMYVRDVVLREVNRLCRRLDLPFQLEYRENESDSNFIANTPYGDVAITRLSFGQRVMLSVLTAFIFYVNSNSTGVLLADEPTAGLDSKNVNMLLGLFDILHEMSLRRNIQCIFSSHEYSLYSGSAYHVIDLTPTVE